MFEYDSETEFNYDGGLEPKYSVVGLAVAFFVGFLIVLIVMVVLASTDNLEYVGKLDVRKLWSSNAADPKTERLSAVWKNSERLTSKDPEFKGAYERTCGARNN